MTRAISDLLFIIVICTAVSCTGTRRIRNSDAADPPRLKPASRLIAVGGGEIDDDMARRIIEFAGGPEVNMLIIPFASQRPEAGEESARAWRERGMIRVSWLSTPAENPDTNDDQNAGDASSVHSDTKSMDAAIREADFIWISGGDQNRLMKTLNALGLSDDVRERFAAGAVVGGTSAGAAALSKLMLTGQSRLDRLAMAAGDVADGLGLWPEVIVDQHFIARQRFNRLLAAVLEHRSLVGIGIDEATGVIVNGDALEVFGQGQVLILDARHSTAEKYGAEPAQAVRGVRVQVLSSGAKWSPRDPSPEIQAPTGR